ncbi:MgtC family protein [Caballeronia arvi]|uniref:MgtC family protein n=2 Tax=Caballeronia arvi TaxID=1777135 RepID=A0A158L300_9BURK|nr:MgtC family protein [Caballeronia arvi]
MESQPLSFHSLTSEDAEGDASKVKVMATVRAHPTYQAKLERMASRMSMERGVSSISCSATDVKATPE